MSELMAVAVFSGEINGSVHFIENGNLVDIHINLCGFEKKIAEYGFHVHEAGDLTLKCTSMCAHFNPYGKNHSGPNIRDNNGNLMERHVGDLGNIKTDFNGNINYTISDDHIKLRGDANIIGRGLVIHKDPDDFGLGGHPDSLKNGHSGDRIACAVIGYAKQNFE
jgi:Cu-Zn family superoxide dismutase